MSQRPARNTSSFDAAVGHVTVARAKHFPRWKRATAAAALGSGVGLLVCSMVLGRPVPLSGSQALAAADICYMAGIALVLFELLHLLWVAVRMPAAPARAAHERMVVAPLPTETTTHP